MIIPNWVATGLDLAWLGYGGLFAAAFVAATVLPAQSEVVLATMLTSGRYEPSVLLLTATSGNVLGSVLNWYLGRNLARFRNAAWFPFSSASMDKAEARFSRYGHWILLFSWVPVIGDPLTLVAGVLQVRFLIFVVIVIVAKFMRYAVLAASILGWAL
ncbi:YqaA family protein [Qipengyuania citrea]|uniref:YqaA family protein n=1 Tax=Qipengyuania citrea TaxID=225971 RepID=UPI0020A0D4B0|nr:membrane protein YqaA with SNARE-associated domain [Qipengyuania citrea]